MLLVWVSAAGRANMRKDTIRKVTLSIVGAAAAVASLLLIRSTKQVTPKETIDLPADETAPETVSLERLRELGI